MVAKTEQEIQEEKRRSAERKAQRERRKKDREEEEAREKQAELDRRNGVAAEPTPAKVPDTTTSEKKTDYKRGPADHLYDTGHQRWEQFDAEKALDELDQQEKNANDPSKAEQVTEEDVETSALDGEIESKMAQLGSRYREDLMFAMDSKRKGNTKLKSGHPDEAVQQYARGIQRLSTMHTFVMGEKMKAQLAQLKIDLNNNAAQASLKLRQWQDAKTFASNVLEQDKANLKALYRRGSALARMGDVHQARLDLEAAQLMSPGSKEISTALRGLPTAPTASTSANENDHSPTPPTEPRPSSSSQPRPPSGPPPSSSSPNPEVADMYTFNAVEDSSEVGAASTAESPPPAHNPALPVDDDMD